MPSSKPRPAAAAKKKYNLGKSGPVEVELTMPSGQTCLARRPGVDGLIKAGVLDSFDSLTSLIAADIKDLEQPGALAKGVAGLQANANDLMSALALVNKVVCFVVVEPTVKMPPTEEEPDPDRPVDGSVEPSDWDWRDPEAVYADDIELDDRMFILNWSIGGSSDLEAFRQGQATGVAAVEDGTVV